jgi:hypothetical protein
MKSTLMSFIVPIGPEEARLEKAFQDVTCALSRLTSLPHQGQDAIQAQFHLRRAAMYIARAIGVELTDVERPVYIELPQHLYRHNEETPSEDEVLRNLSEEYTGPPLEKRHWFLLISEKDQKIIMRETLIGGITDEYQDIGMVHPYDVAEYLASTGQYDGYKVQAIYAEINEEGELTNQVSVSGFIYGETLVDWWQDGDIRWDAFVMGISTEDFLNDNY